MVAQIYTRFIFSFVHGEMKKGWPYTITGLEWLSSHARSKFKVIVLGAMDVVSYEESEIREYFVEYT